MTILTKYPAETLRSESVKVIKYKKQKIFKKLNFRKYLEELCYLDINTRKTNVIIWRQMHFNTVFSMLNSLPDTL